MKKTLIAAAALLTLGTAMAEAAPRRVHPAPVHRGHNAAPWIAGGLALGLLGAGIAAQQYYQSCHYERRRVFDDYGRFIGWRDVRVCD